MKKIFFYTRLTDTLITIATCLFFFTLFLLITFINERKVYIAIAGGLCFLLLLILVILSFKYLLKKEKLIAERYEDSKITEIPDVLKKFDEELEGL